MSDLITLEEAARDLIAARDNGWNTVGYREDLWSVLSAALSVPAAAVVGEPVIEHAEWLEACATNEPSQSDAEKLWTCAQLIRTLASRISQQLERVRRELEEAKRTSVGDWANQRENDHLTIKMYEWKARAESAEAKLAQARQAAFIEAAEIAGKLLTAEFTPQEPGFMRGIGYAAQTIFDDLRAKAEETMP